MRGVWHRGPGREDARHTSELGGKTQMDVKTKLAEINVRRERGKREGRDRISINVRERKR